MKKLLLIACFVLMGAGCLAYPESPCEENPLCMRRRNNAAYIKKCTDEGGWVDVSSWDGQIVRGCNKD